MIRGYRYPLGNMPWLRNLLLAYAALTAAIGTYGYVGPLLNPSPDHKASPISMIAGLAIGALVAGGVFVANKNRMAGYTMCLVGALAVLGQFGRKAVEGIVFPAGVMTLLSVIAVGALVAGHFIGRNASRAGVGGTES